jgi:hypothetical protein
LFADDNGIVIYSSPMETDDTLIYEYNPLAGGVSGSDSLIVNLGSGIYPHDTLIASPVSHLKELDQIPFKILNGNEYWRLISAGDHYQGMLVRVLDLSGKELYTDHWLEEETKSVPMPPNSAIYILNYKLKNGLEGAVRLFRP